MNKRKSTNSKVTIGEGENKVFAEDVPTEIVDEEPRKKICYKNEHVPRGCPGECKGASIHWHWDTCGYGRLVQDRREGARQT